MSLAQCLLTGSVEHAGSAVARLSAPQSNTAAHIKNLESATCQIAFPLSYSQCRSRLDFFVNHFSLGGVYTIEYMVAALVGLLVARERAMTSIRLSCEERGWTGTFADQSANPIPSYPLRL